MDLIRQNKSDLPGAGQIIYSELAVAEFPKLKDYLVTEVGYSKDEIGIITGLQAKIKESPFRMILIKEKLKLLLVVKLFRKE